MPRLISLAEQAAAANPVTPDNLSLHVDFSATHVDVRKQFLALDEAMFTSLTSALNDTQAVALNRVRLDRRRTASVLLGSMIPSAEVDLTRFLRPYQMDIDPMHAVRLDKLLQEYEAEVSPLMEELCEECIHRTRLISKNEVKQRFGSDGLPLDPSTPAARAQFDAGRKARLNIIKAGGHLQLRIAELNATSLPGLIECHVVSIQGNIRQAFDEKTLPAVYPDPLDPTDLFGRIRETAAANPEAIESLDGLRIVHQQGYASVSTKMVEAFRDWRKSMALTQSALPQKFQSYRKSMREWRDGRWLLNKALIDDAVVLLDSSAKEQTATLVEAYRQKHDALKSRAARDSYPGP